MTRPDPVSLRLPEPLKSSIQQAANQAGRSLNAEIRMRLEWSFEAGFDGSQSAPALEQASDLEVLRAQVRALESKLNAIPVDQLKRFAELMQKLERGEVVTLASST